MLLKRSRQEVDGTLAPHDGLGESSTKNELADDVLEGLWILENETKEKKKSFNWHPNWGIYRDFGFKTQITSITNCLMMPVKHLHSYPQVLWFDKATERLRRQRENLALARDQLQYFVEVAIGKNEEVAEEIETWLTKANDALDDVQILENEIKENKRCFFKKSPNWSWRYRLSKRVTKNRDDVTEAVSEYQLVLHSATLSGRQFFKSEDHYMLFESPRSALNQIMEALEGDEFNKIVLCGIEGVGKTALVEQVETIAKNSPHFDNVVQAVVSQKEDIRDIQVQIAKSLGLEFEVPTIEGKREELRMRLNNKNILVILDDVWGELNLNEIGIPYVQNLMKCKILLATCREQLCNPGNYEKKVLLDGLTDAESWVLFKTVAGLTTTSMPDLQKVALEIVKKFNGWPIAITASAKELRGKPLDYWEAASKNVRGKTLEDWKVVSEKPERSEEDDIVYNSLKSSYDYFCLKQRENKLCFFLCYLFPEGSKIDVEDLMSCAIGLELHHSVKTIDEARSDTHATINILKDLNLLLGSGKMQFKMMEKIIRDVALSIASKEENFFIKSGVNLQEWPRNESFETCTAISMVSNKIKRLCDGFVSEKLKILLLTGDGCMRVSSKFFQGLKALKVLIFNDGILSLHALQNLTNLQTLHLKHCELCHIAELGKLKNLEMLSFRGSTIEELPNEIGGLSRLKLLNLSNCEKLRKIQPNLIGRLSNLEELYVSGSFKEWELEETTEEGSNASLLELNTLSCLSILSLEVHHRDSPKDFVLRTLGRYQLAINEDEWFDSDYQTSRSLRISSFSLNAFKGLFPNVEDLHLSSIVGYQNLLPSLDPMGLNNLKFLAVRRCNDMECILDATLQHEPINPLPGLKGLVIEEMNCLKELCNAQHPRGFLENLDMLTITKCDSLKFVVPDTQVREIRVKDCAELEAVYQVDVPKMEEILHANSERNSSILLLNLTHLELFKLHKLRYIWNVLTPRIISCPCLKVVKVKDCSKLTSLFSSFDPECLSRLETLRIQGCHALKQIFTALKDDNILPCFSSLRTLEVTDCSVLETIFPISAIPQLRLLQISKLPQLKQVFHFTGELEGKKKVLPQLQKLALKSLKNLSKFCPGLDFISLPSLDELMVKDCPKLAPFIIPLQQTKKVQIKELYLSRVGNHHQSNATDPEMERPPSVDEYIEVGNSKEIFQVRGGYFFSNLEKLTLEHFSELIVIWKDPTQILTLQNLTYLKVAHCKGLRNIFSLILARNLPQLSHLEVQECDNLEQIITEDRIPSSSKTCSGDIYFPNLIKVHVEKCNKLKTLFPASAAASLPKLKFFKVMGASALKQIFGPECEANNIDLKKKMVVEYKQKMALPQLKDLFLEDLPSLVSLIPTGYHYILPHLDSLYIKGCSEMVTSFTLDSDITVHIKTEEFKLQEEDMLKILFTPKVIYSKKETLHTNANIHWSRNEQMKLPDSELA